jgi:hypothetical protein
MGNGHAACGGVEDEFFEPLMSAIVAGAMAPADARSAGCCFVKRRREPAGRFGGPFGQAISQASVQSRMPSQTQIRFAIRASSF